MNMTQHLVAAMVIVSMLTAGRADQPPKNGFTVRCLNKDSVLFPEKRGELNLKVECLVVVEREIQLKPGDFRLALLDAKLRQLDEISIAIPDDWKTKTFKKGANKDTLTMNLQGGDVVAGREYYLAIMISTRGTDNVFPVVVRFVKFKVSNVDPGRTDDDPQRVPPAIKQPMPEAKELPKGVVAAENEAEKLFRAMEQKIRTAKTLQLRSDATITGANGKQWHIKGSLFLGAGDKFREESEGKRFGHEWKRTVVSDGTDKTSFGYDQAPGEDKVLMRGKGTEKTPKAIGAYLRQALPRDGFVLCFATDRHSQMPPDLFIMSDFKLAGAEKIGARNTQVIQYSVKTKARDPSFNPASANVLSLKVWLDTNTKLPVKLTMTGGESGFSAITETYREFTVDAKVDAKWFELPK